MLRVMRKKIAKKKEEEEEHMSGEWKFFAKRRTISSGQLQDRLTFELEIRAGV